MSTSTPTARRLTLVDRLDALDQTPTIPRLIEAIRAAQIIDRELTPAAAAA